MNELKITFTEEQFLVFHEFVMNTKLGDGNKFEIAMAELAESLDNKLAWAIVFALAEEHGKPIISAQLDKHGATFIVDDEVDW